MLIAESAIGSVQESSSSLRMRVRLATAQSIVILRKGQDFNEERSLLVIALRQSKMCSWPCIREYFLPTSVCSQAEQFLEVSRHGSTAVGRVDGSPEGLGQRGSHPLRRRQTPKSGYGALEEFGGVVSEQHSMQCWNIMSMINLMPWMAYSQIGDHAS